ncbi:hypothetical protein DACRYDRAFT_19553 [Dacryopinax primogenitus]|uniref:Uncharacterized protein n=1 Tax=Dacryopinax primogenitus (strain DJM 731) TaxID=1858805 RepID=M5G832_DACPD|nr:uncharacterized protein DACRYDRAFT_19553 [Dacryopinax primogenitus]EJU06371.1 hypothetical protein DACRYDRAFT_19553 [Dacryopinax primogenitus]
MLPEIYTPVADDLTLRTMSRSIGIDSPTGPQVRTRKREDLPGEQPIAKKLGWILSWKRAIPKKI